LGDTEWSISFGGLGMYEPAGHDHPQPLFPHGVTGPCRVLSKSSSSAVLVKRSLCVVSLSRGISPVKLDSEVFPELLPPRSLRPHDYPLLGFSPPSGHYPYYPPERLSTPAPPMEFLPLQRMRHGESAWSWGLPSPARSGFRVSHPLAGLLLPVPPGFISPR
jgi:hypothetical protein